jgi:hypothetical protein
MAQSEPDSDLRLAWIGTPLRKRFDETLELPIPREFARLLEGCETVLVSVRGSDKSA